MQFQVVAHGRTRESGTEEELEVLAERVGDLLEDRAEDIALGLVVGYHLLKSEIEFEFTVEARSPEEFHKKLGQITRLLEDEGVLEYKDSTASRIDPEIAREREAVLA